MGHTNTILLLPVPVTFRLEDLRDNFEELLIRLRIRDNKVFGKRIHLLVRPRHVGQVIDVVRKGHT